jgi:hypothetical protein
MMHSGIDHKSEVRISVATWGYLPLAETLIVWQGDKPGPLGIIVTLIGIQPLTQSSREIRRIWRLVHFGRF